MQLVLQSVAQPDMNDNKIILVYAQNFKTCNRIGVRAAYGFASPTLRGDAHLWNVIWCFCSPRSSGGIVDSGPDYQKNLSDEVTKLQRLYGGGDMAKFPEIKFTGQFTVCTVSVFVSQTVCSPTVLMQTDG